MSVTKNFRSISKLKVVVDAIELCSYTMDTCGKEDYFPKRSRWMLAEKIVNLSQEVVDHIIKGNEIVVESVDDFLTRRNHQREAYGACESMLVFLAIAYRRYKIPDNSIEFWTGNIVNVETMIANWRKSDMSRYKKFIPQDLLKDEVDYLNDKAKDETKQNEDLPFEE